MYDYQFRIIMSGDSNVGKTTFCNYIQSGDIDVTGSTIGIDFFTQDIHVDGLGVRLQLWDTAGQEKYHCITDSYYKAQAGVILMFDLSNLESFNNLEYYMSKIEKYKHSSILPVIYLIGNKNDKTHIVKKEQIDFFVEKYNLTYFETSLLNDCENITTIVEHLIRKICVNSSLVDVEFLKLYGVKYLGKTEMIEVPLGLPQFDYNDQLPFINRNNRGCHMKCCTIL